MILKHSKCIASHLTPLDLLGTHETGLSKAFGYVLAKEPQALFTFLRSLGIRARNTHANYLATELEIEHSEHDERTDIEIRHASSYHVIVECKIGSGKVTKQRTQYLSRFLPVPNRVMCFITQQRDTKRQRTSGIITRRFSWMDILDAFEGAWLQNVPVVRQFMMFAIRTYKMKTQKEILVQDLSKPAELTRYMDYYVYKRDVTFGTPLYFAPYFTQNVDKNIGQGIKYLSPVLGVLTLKPCEINEYGTELLSFWKNSSQVAKWMSGTKLGDDEHQSTEHTFYFLGKRVELPAPLFKEGTIKKGRGKNWIAGMIPKNRCVTFGQFVERLKKAPLT